NREIAWRVFAGEYNDANQDVSDGGERSPSYVVTPLGAKINRLFVVGVLTDVENVATDEAPMWRARLQDPTGTYHMYAGQYQPEASAALAKLKRPAFAAVTGQSRLFPPDSRGTYPTIRPQTVKAEEEGSAPDTASKAADAAQEAREQTVLGIIGELDSDGKGASWDGITARAGKAGVDKDALEELINSLLDKGLIYEPILGRMKKI